MNNGLTKAILVHLVVISCGLWLLIPVVWGLLGGAIGAFVVERSPEFRQKVQDFLSERGIDSNAAPSVLTANDKRALRQMSEDLLQKKIQWFWLALCAAILVFGPTGFISGLVSGRIVLACVFPLIACIILPPYLKGPVGMSLAMWKKVVIVFFQFGTSLLFACLGARMYCRARRSGVHGVCT
jgi:hypothetical protein